MSRCSHSNAGRKKKIRGVKGDGPGVLCFVASPGWHNHGENIMSLPHENTP